MLLLRNNEPHDPLKVEQHWIDSWLSFIIHIWSKQHWFWMPITGLGLVYEQWAFIPIPINTYLLVLWHKYTLIQCLRWWIIKYYCFQYCHFINGDCQIYKYLKQYLQQQQKIPFYNHTRLINKMNLFLRSLLHTIKKYK